jgi:hypothetical protein
MFDQAKERWIAVFGPLECPPQLGNAAGSGHCDRTQLVIPKRPGRRRPNIPGSRVQDQYPNAPKPESFAFFSR